MGSSLGGMINYPGTPKNAEMEALKRRGERLQEKQSSPAEEVYVKDPRAEASPSPSPSPKKKKPETYSASEE